MRMHSSTNSPTSSSNPGCCRTIDGSISAASTARGELDISVLTRLWAGYVAASLDLVGIFDGGFNGRMSRKLLAIVEEINKGGNTSYRHPQTLRQLVTAEHREINPNTGCSTSSTTHAAG